MKVSPNILGGVRHPGTFPVGIGCNGLPKWNPLHNCMHR
mgnify:CR=1 FL=1